MVRGKRTDGLMIHLRDNKNVNIKGSRQKKELLSMGYYHGYKGYRFIRNSNNPIPYRDFDHVSAVYNFDMNIKTIFYPLIMTIETALKNYTLDTLVSFGKVDLDYAFKEFLDDYKSETPNTEPYKRKLRDQLLLKKKIHNTIHFKYNKESMITHFVDSKSAIPLWAIFEILDMGDFGLFLKCLNENIRKQNCKNISIYHSSINDKGRLVQDILFTLKNLRNAVAHNSPIFDCRFSNQRATRELKSYVSVETNISNINFRNIVDYFVLSILILKKIGKTKTDLKKTIKRFEEEIEELRNSVPNSLWASLVETSTNSKLNGLRLYV